MTAWLALTILAAGATVTPALQGRETFVSTGIERTYELYVPASAPAQPPVLVLLHGSYATGKHMVASWREIADREGLVLVAPDALDGKWWRIQEDGPQLFLDLLHSVAARHPVDHRRVYLFGHSGGGVYALTLGLLESEYFAAIAVHGGAWRTPGEYRVLPLAQRKIPVALFLGTRDEFFPLKSVYETSRALRRAGHPVRVETLPRYRHAFARAAAAVNEQAWAFLRGYSLNTDPTFRSYAREE